MCACTRIRTREGVPGQHPDIERQRRGASRRTQSKRAVGLLDLAGTGVSRDWHFHDGGPSWERMGGSEVTRLGKLEGPARRPEVVERRAPEGVCRARWEREEAVADVLRGREEGHAAAWVSRRTERAPRAA